MKRAWATAITILSGGAIASCATLLGADGDYELAGSSSGSGGAGVSSASSAAGTGGDPTTTVSVSVSSSASVSSSDSSSGIGGAGGAVGPPSWHRHSFDMATGTWSSASLDSVWIGPNAPPSTGIVASCHLDHFDKLLIITDTGMIHIQDAGVWLPPTPAKTLFPEILDPAGIADLYHVPSDWNVTPMAQPLLEGLVIVNNPTYWLYDFSSNNTATFTGQGVVPATGQPSGPPQDTVKAKWFFSIWNKSQIGQADGYATWSSYNDGSVYKIGADIVFEKWPIASGPIWAGKPGAPVWSTLTAAYFIGHPADGIGTVVFIGP